MAWAHHGFTSAVHEHAWVQNAGAPMKAASPPPVHNAAHSPIRLPSPLYTCATPQVLLMGLAEAAHSNRTLVWGLDLPFTFEITRSIWQQAAEGGDKGNGEEEGEGKSRSGRVKDRRHGLKHVLTIPGHRESDCDNTENALPPSPPPLPHTHTHTLPRPLSPQAPLLGPFLWGASTSIAASAGFGRGEARTRASSSRSAPAPWQMPAWRSW